MTDCKQEIELLAEKYKVHLPNDILSSSIIKNGVNYGNNRMVINGSVSIGDRLQQEQKWLRDSKAKCYLIIIYKTCCYLKRT